MVLILGTVAVLGVFSILPLAAAGQVKDLDGAWFSCEFAHSQIAPDDGCKMLDDDGFLITGKTIDHIKVRNSTETACRQNRVGNCFRRDTAEITVIRESTGDFVPTADGFQISYWGCLQDYKIEQRQGYFEINPVGDLCYWTSDKRYFLARYAGSIDFAAEEKGFSLFSSER